MDQIKLINQYGNKNYENEINVSEKMVKLFILNAPFGVFNLPHMGHI